MNGKSTGWVGVLVQQGLLPREIEARNRVWVRVTESSVIKCPAIVTDSSSKEETGNYSDQTYGLIKGRAGTGENVVFLGPPSCYSSDPEVYRHVVRSNMAKSEYKEIPLGGDGIHTRDGYQPGNLEMTLPSTANRYAAAGSAERVIHLRHIGKGNLFYADGHDVSAAAKDITPQTYMKYADKVNGGVRF